MRIAFLADIHGNLGALRAVVADLSRCSPDLVVTLGDLASGPLQARAAIEEVCSRGWPSVRGNHDRQMAGFGEAGLSDRQALEEVTVDQARWLGALPMALEPIPGVQVFHGTPSDDLAYLMETVEPGGARPARPQEIDDRLGSVRGSLLACGHTHLGRVSLVGPTLVINPGSVGVPAYSDQFPWPHVMEAGTPHARYAWADRTPTGWEVTFRWLEYDWHAAAALAALRGRPDWARALATGTLR